MRELKIHRILYGVLKAAVMLASKDLAAYAASLPPEQPPEEALFEVPEEAELPEERAVHE